MPMQIQNDDRIVMTLDAGGTNFVFSAIRGGKEIVSPIKLPSNADNLDRCLSGIVTGFRTVLQALNGDPVAISFAFPGPADYPAGIIGDLNNLPSFRGGIALGPMLEEEFRLPVYINNDGDLFAYGESIAGFLPEVNRMLEKQDNPRRYRNLLGVTLGTGFGAGIVSDGRLFLGDNSAGAEIWAMSNRTNPGVCVEDGISIRAVRRAYAEQAGIAAAAAPSPKEIYDIALGTRPGNTEAARRSFAAMGTILGDALANALTLIDGLAVIGGGLSGASALFLPAVISEMNSAFSTPEGPAVHRMESRVYNLDDPGQQEEFLRFDFREVAVPGSQRKLLFDPVKRVGIGVSRLGTSKAIAIGAYAFALQSLGW